MRNVLFIYNSTATRLEKRLDGARRYLRSSGWDVRLVELSGETPHLRETLRQWNPLGCIVERGSAHGRAPLRLFRKIPTVFVDQGDGAACDGWNILHDSSATARMAFAELRRLSPRHFAFVRDARNLAWSREREQTFLKLTAKRPASVLDDNAHLAERLAELPRPCGVLAANDAVARHVVNAAMLAEIRLPNDLQIVGINNDVFLCENTTPTLTSVQPDFERSGYLAMETLRRAVEHPRLRPRTLGYGPLATIRRASTRLLPRLDARVTQALDIIASDFANPELTADTLVARIGCSRRLLDLRFREITGRSIRESIREARLDNAKRLLRDPTRDILEIPALCGCASATTFMRFFKAKTGRTMTEFRSGGNS